MNETPDHFGAEFDALLKVSEMTEGYTRQLTRVLPAVVPVEYVSERQRVYREMRAALIALTTFAAAADTTLGREACRELFPGFDFWYGYPNVPGHINVLLDYHCDCCGLPLRVRDPLGQERFQIGQFTQACAHCFELLKTSYPDTPRRLARLKAFAAQQPDLLAPTVVAALERRAWSIEECERALKLDERRFLQLVLFQRPEAAEREQAVSIIAALLQCPQKILRALLEDGWTVPAMPQ